MQSRASKHLLAAGVLALVASSLTPASAITGTTERISVSTAKRQAAAPTPAVSVPDTTSPQISLDGRWVVFSSDASNLVASDTNAVADVFLRDLKKGTTTRVSAARGVQANGASYSPAISVDGSLIAFVSRASNLVPGDTNGAADVFVLDRRSKIVTLVSRAPGGAPANGDSNTPFVSLFGDWITFESAASNLASGDGNGMPDAFVFTRKTKKIERLAPAPLERSDASDYVTWTARPTISYDGMFVSYIRQAAARDQLQTITEELQSSDPFLRNRARGRSRMIDLPKWNGRFRALADHPAISADGKRIVFEAHSVLDADAAMKLTDPTSALEASDRTLGHDELDTRDVWLYDRIANQILVVSRNAYGFAANADSWGPQISSQGHTVAFVSQASNLVPGDTNGAADVFVYDSRERALSRVSVSSDAAPANGASDRIAMSYDGRHLVYGSAASNLITGDSNAVSDVFHHDRRIDAVNNRPVLDSIGKNVRSVLVGEEHVVRLQAQDADGDPLRFGILVAVPPKPVDASDPAVDVARTYSLDPMTGTFRWRPTPNQDGPWTFAFWVADQRGGDAYVIAQFVVRNPLGASLCPIRGDC